MTSKFAFATALLLGAFIAHGGVISIGGNFLGYSSIGGIAQGWSMPFSDTVSISAVLENGDGPIPGTGNVAYLTEGATPSLADVVASLNFTIPGNFIGVFPLFSNVSLDAGSYWLIFSGAPPTSFASWAEVDPTTITLAPEAQYLGFAFSSDGNMTFGPAFNEGFSAYEMTVSDTPEPSSVLLCLTGLAGLAYLFFRR